MPLHVYAKKLEKCTFFHRFMVKDSAEVSAEASVKVAEASVSAESRLRVFRSFTISDRDKM